MRSSLVTALVSCAASPVKPTARRFLLGLSSDELQFIAEFLGASILESVECRRSRAQLAEQIARYQEECASRRGCPSQDQDHKMILLLEYLSRSGTPQSSLSAGA